MSVPQDTLTLIQGSPEWAAARAGYVTASEFSSVLAKGQGKTRAAYLRRIVCERLTGKPTETYRNANMERGNIQEPFARLSYESITGNLVEEVGIIRHPTLKVSASPDGLIDTDGGCEIKSVIPTVQLDTILAGAYPSEHRAQIQGSLWVAGEADILAGRKPRGWWDFCSHSPDMPEHLRTYIFRVVRDEAYILNLAAEVTVFLGEVEALLTKLKERK